ncbi:hypothetical protein BT93_L4661 [Corymbia citriodora subsp. variegata]|uniref:alcohol O-acetyltransferase n=1 Tax=Corymbia citriodora subsp. variegata TaxID=360336 RepID=A0A8T0CFP0_CORYI|nr:hypothetical protein BT93_L4661 [Corymbia citriodora subsp. variegata]
MLDLHTVTLSLLAALPLVGLLLGTMSRVFGFGSKKFYYGKKSITMRTRDGGEVLFGDLCKSVLPTIRLNPFLFNGHLQTMWSVVKSNSATIYYKRHLFEQEDALYPGQFAIDFAVKPYQESDSTLPPRTTYYSADEWSKIASDDTRPMLVALHGLSGGSYELYLRHVLAPLISEQYGWEACVVNGRGCALSKITTPMLFNARSTWDVRQTVNWLRKTFPNRPLYGVGFSLGANILTNYVGEEGGRCELRAAVVLSCPWALEVSSNLLQRTFLGLQVYSRTMGTNLRRLFDIHKDMILRNPAINIKEVESAKYLHEWDRAVQCASWGYPTETAYYRDASSVDSVFAIRIPFLAISALDDPIVGAEAIPFQEFSTSTYGVLCTTSLGGHLSWFELGGGRWMAKATTAFFNKLHSEIDPDSYLRGQPDNERPVNPRPQARPRFDPMRRRLHDNAS